MKIGSKNRGEDDDSDEDSEELSSDSDLDEMQEEEDIKYYVKLHFIYNYYIIIILKENLIVFS